MAGLSLLVSEFDFFLARVNLTGDWDRARLYKKFPQTKIHEHASQRDRSLRLIDQIAKLNRSKGLRGLGQHLQSHPALVWRENKLDGDVFLDQVV